MSPHPFRVAIVGGGPGGLFTAYRLQQRCSAPFTATIYEATNRLGGKVLTARFGAVPLPFEAGAAELYDYSRTGHDPLRQLIDEMGLAVRPMHGSAVIFKNEIIPAFGSTRAHLGDTTWAALEEFDAQAHAWMTPQQYYDADWADRSLDPNTVESFDSLLARVPDATARRYLATLVHSDVATEPHQTNASYGLQNYLMNDPAYLSLYTIDGGIERLPQAVASRLATAIRLNEPVVSVEQLDDGSIEVTSRHNGEMVSAEYDYVVVALPNNWIPAIDWQGELLSDAMRRHHMHYDHPAHYLRVTMLFRESFWRPWLAASRDAGRCSSDAYFMLDAFGGCCLYDQSPAAGPAPSGVLGWLLAGEAALTLANLGDEDIVRVVLDALPPALAQGRELLVETQVHRWVGSVNGLPGGVPAMDMDTRHRPEPVDHDNLFVVGDYLFDSTLNGVLDSADYVTELLVEEMQ